MDAGGFLLDIFGDSDSTMLAVLIFLAAATFACRSSRSIG